MNVLPYVACDALCMNHRGNGAMWQEATEAIDTNSWAVKDHLF